MENIKGQWNFTSSKKLERMRGEKKKKIRAGSFVVGMISVEFAGVFQRYSFFLSFFFSILRSFFLFSFFHRGTLPNRILQDKSSVIGIVVDVQTDSSMNSRFLWSVTFAIPEQFKAESPLSSVKPWKTGKYYSRTDLRSWTVAHGLAELSERKQVFAHSSRGSSRISTPLFLLSALFSRNAYLLVRQVASKGEGS